MNGLAKLVRRAEYGVLLLVAGMGLILPSCDWDGNFVILGYSTCSQFDKKYHTIRVPIFQNVTFYRGLEFDLTQAVVNEIERRTHLKVVQGDADLELTGKIVFINKNVTLAGPTNQIRNSDLSMKVEIVLKDLRTGQLLSKTPRRPGLATPEEVPFIRDNPTLPGTNALVPTAPAVPGSVDQDATMTGPPGAPPALPVVPGQTFGPDEPLDPKVKPPGFPITATGYYIPEMGMSTTTAEQRCVFVMSREIVNMMEIGW